MTEPLMWTLRGSGRENGLPGVWGGPDFSVHEAIRVIEAAPVQALLERMLENIAPLKDPEAEALLQRLQLFPSSAQKTSV